MARFQRHRGGSTASTHAAEYQDSSATACTNGNACARLAPIPRRPLLTPAAASVTMRAAHSTTHVSAHSHPARAALTSVVCSHCEAKHSPAAGCRRRHLRARGAAQEWQWQPLFFFKFCRALRPLPDCSGASSKWQLEVPVVWPAALRLLQLGDAMNGSTKVGAWPRG